MLADGANGGASKRGAINSGVEGLSLHVHVECAAKADFGDKLSNKLWGFGQPMTWQNEMFSASVLHD